MRKHTKAVRFDAGLFRRIVAIRRPTSKFIERYNANLFHAFKVEVAR